MIITKTTEDKIAKGGRDGMKPEACSRLPLLICNGTDEAQQQIARNLFKIAGK